MSARRNGIIAQLPRAIRDHVNVMLDDGQPYHAIIDWLDANGHPGVKPDHISNWKDGGFQEWLQLERELARQERIREVSYEIATQNEGSKTQEAAIQIAANFLCEVFLKFDPQKLAEALDLDPKHITTVLNAFSRINRRGNETEMLKEWKRHQEQQRLAASQEKVVSSVPPGLSAEGRKQIEGAYNL